MADEVNPRDFITCYGIKYRKGVTKIAVELDCYRHDHPESEGGLGAERHFKNAFAIMWPKYEHNEWTDMMIHAWCTYKYITVVGHQRAGKTFSYAHIAYLDYLAHPMDTLTSIATVTFEGLKLRMWSDLLRAVETQAMPDILEIRSTTNECRIFPKEYRGGPNEKFQIHGMSVSRTQDAPGRIRGGHANRRRIILDEAQDMPPAIFDAMVNPMSAPDARCVLLSNPVEKISKFGEWCEPEDGWNSVNETDLAWKTKKGGICLHFDGLQSPNFRAGKTVYPYMLTQEGADEVEKMHGKESVQYWALIRGFFPPDGLVSRVFPSSVIEKGRPAIKFDFNPSGCATLDPAFEADNCVLIFGQIGTPIFGERHLKINATECVVMKYDARITAEPKDYQIAHFVIEECEKRGIPPKHFIQDTTGNGRGVFAILQKEWSREIQGLNYGGEASDRQLRADDNRKCSEIFKYFISEIYFRASECMKAGLIGGLDNIDSRVIDDITSRRYSLKNGTKGSLMVVETKAEVKKRLGRSPDFGDALVQFGELLYRLGTIPGGGMAMQLKSGSAWTRARDRAKRASDVYAEA